MFGFLIETFRKLDYKELKVWKKSRQLVSELYEMTRLFPDTERYGLSGQIRSAGVSIPANIAEGCGRHTNKETLRFLFIARGSLYELETHLYLALDQSFINSNQFKAIDYKVKECMRLLAGFIRYYKNRN